MCGSCAFRWIPWASGESGKAPGGPGYARAAADDLHSGCPGYFPPRLLADFGAIVTLHHITDCIFLVEGLQALGVDPDCMTVISKDYPYPHPRRVAAHLRHRLGVPTFSHTRIEAAVMDHVRRVESKGRRSLIMDNGGYVAPVLLSRLREHLPAFIGLVEATAAGIVRLRKRPPLPMPVFNFAESRVKSSFEPSAIAEATMRSIAQLLPNEKFAGQPALVVGFGRVGQQVADALRTRQMRVAVYDRDIVQLVAAHERGFVTGDDLTALLRHHAPLLIIGATGRGALGGEHFAALSRSCFLASVTSRDREFAVNDLADRAVAVARDEERGTAYLLPGGVRVTALAHGYPVTFFHLDGLPNKVSDLIYASLLVGASTLARPGHGLTAAASTARTDEILSTCPLLRDYYRLYGPVAV